MVAVFLDLTQFFLDWLLVGLVINPFIDLGIGFILPIYLRRQGVKSDWKRYATWIGGGLIELLSDNLLPIGWTLEMILNMIFDNLDKRIHSI